MHRYPSGAAPRLPPSVFERYREEQHAPLRKDGSHKTAWRGLSPPPGERKKEGVGRWSRPAPSTSTKINATLGNKELSVPEKTFMDYDLATLKKLAEATNLLDSRRVLESLRKSKKINEDL